MTAKEMASKVADDLNLHCGDIPKAWAKEIQEALAKAIDDAVQEERKAAANLAWEMQMEQFGGGTAIGNAIAEGQRAKTR